MNRLQRNKRSQIILVVLAALALAGMIAYNAMKPATEDESVGEISQTILAVDWHKLNDAEREHYRRQWQGLNPETRDKVWLEVSRQRLGEMRREMTDLSPAQRAARIRDAVARLRQRRERLGQTERERIRQRLNAPEARQLIKKMMNFYQKELTAKERAELDPLVHEWLYQIEEITGHD